MNQLIIFELVYLMFEQTDWPKLIQTSQDIAFDYFLICKAVCVLYKEKLTVIVLQCVRRVTVICHTV